MAKRMVKGALRRLGYEIWRAGTAAPHSPDPWPWVRTTKNIQTVIDIGANDGEFASFLSDYFKPSATFVFEPLASQIPALRAKAASIPNCCVFNIALSDRAGREILYMSSYGPSTSLLRPGEALKEEFPQAAVVTPTLVDVLPLDDVLNPDNLEKNILIKIDVQGFEDRVIRGGRRVFSAAECVLIEMSFVAMYEGQPLFEEVHSLLVDLGYRMAGTKNQIYSSHSGRPLFAHCLYIRSDMPGRTAR